MKITKEELASRVAALDEEEVDELNELVQEYAETGDSHTARDILKILFYEIYA
tara:strand:+ start:440 stop:598 length:159 start_codon:yes stop_codon:yes gene_type:complete